jgi:hypothetical protein
VKLHHAFEFKLATQLSKRLLLERQSSPKTVNSSSSMPVPLKVAPQVTSCHQGVWGSEVGGLMSIGPLLKSRHPRGRKTVACFFPHSEVCNTDALTRLRTPQLWHVICEFKNP